MVILLKNVEFRRYDVEKKLGKAYDKDGNAIPGKQEEYTKRVLRVEVDGEGVIARLWEDSPVQIPDTLKRGDLVDVEINGFQTVKDATYIQVVKLVPVKAGK